LFVFMLIVVYWLYLGLEAVSIFKGCNTTPKVTSVFPMDTSVYDKNGKLIKKYEIMKPGDTSVSNFYVYNINGLDSIRLTQYKYSNVRKSVIEWKADYPTIIQTYKSYDNAENLIDSIVVVHYKITRKLKALFDYNGRNELRYSYVNLDTTFVEKIVFYDPLCRIIKTDTIRKGDRSPQFTADNLNKILFKLN